MKILRQGEPGYEQAREDSIWHEGVPQRYPAIIIQVDNDQEVVDAIKLAESEGLKVSVKSGGYSWAGNHLRDESCLIDLSLLKEVVVEGMTAKVQPGVKGYDLGELLRQRQLFFPVGHCTGVALGGFLLLGGFGWRGRELGPSCMSVTGIEVVTAKGEKVYADENQHPDLFWAARGAGPGFFGVVTRFHLKLYPLQKVTLSNFYIYPPDLWEDFFRWCHAIEGELPAEVELSNILYRNEALSTEGPVVSVLATAYSDSMEKAKELLAPFEKFPQRNRALVANIGMEASTGDLAKNGTEEHYPSDHRFIADNMWTHASFEELLPYLKAIQADFPKAPSHLIWFPWKRTLTRPSMAYSLEDDLYIALYGACSDSADDNNCRNWVTSHMQDMDALSTGIHLADENLINRPQHFMQKDHFEKLESIRGTYDPEQRFVSWLGRPT